MPAPIIEEDLLAYVDGQLEVARRIEVEAYLQDHPDLAARVMQDMRLRDELNLFLTAGPVLGPAAGTAALPVKAASSSGVIPLPARPRRRAVAQLRAAVAAAVFIGIGWSAHALFGNVLADPVAAAHPVPVFADEAVEAHRSAIEAGETFGGQPPEQAPTLARVASQSAGGALPIPDFPKELHALTSRIVPWDVGSAVQVVYEAAGSDRVTLFAAEDGSFSATRPESARFGDLSVVYWQQGHHVYALCGKLPASELMAYAKSVQASWF